MAARRILIHPGFHKTGTSSLQHMLWINRDRLSPHAALLLLRHLQPATKLIHAYSRTQSPVHLTDLVDVLDAVFRDAGLTADDGDDRDLLISCEALSGHLPGWPGVEDYAAAPVIATFLTGYLAERFAGAEIVVAYTTRAPEAWLNSAWRHHLAGQRLRLDWPAFRERYAGAADLDAVVASVAGAISPVPVYALPLEEARLHPLGPGGAMLELLDLPEAVRANLAGVGHDNRGADAALARDLLALNLSDGKDGDVTRAKRATIAAAGGAGWGAR